MLAITVTAGTAWLILIKKGWLVDSGDPRSDLQKARSTRLGRQYLPSPPAGKHPITPKAPPRPGEAVLRDELVESVRLPLASTQTR